MRTQESDAQETSQCFVHPMRHNCSPFVPKEYSRTALAGTHLSKYTSIPTLHVERTMKDSGVDRRKFIASLAGSGAAVSGLTERAFSFREAQSSPASQSSSSQSNTEEHRVSPRIKFAVIGINHYHINSQIE